VSDEIEDFIKDLALKEPSSSLDDKIFNILEKDSSAKEELQLVPKRSWSKILTYAAAAILFLSVGIAEVYRNLTPENATTSLVDSTLGETDENNKASTTTLISTSEDSGDVSSGQIIELEGGILVKPVIRRVIISRTYFDKEKNIQIEVKEPKNEIYYVPLEVD
jgi:hypothetical protein